MFLRRFKEKSNQKYVNAVLNNTRKPIHQKKITSVGILLNYKEYNNYDALRKLLNNIGIKENRVKFISFITEEVSEPNSWDSYFNPKDFGWKGKITNTELNEFISTEFDALISYFTEDILELNLVTAISQANFKIGISNNDHRLFDLIIDNDPKKIDVFEQEIVKYLNVLNKI